MESLDGHFTPEQEPDESSEETQVVGDEYTLKEIEASVTEYLGPETKEPAGIPLEHLEEIHYFFNKFNVVGLEAVREEDIEKLWEKFSKDPFLVEDFTLIVAERLRTVRQSHSEKVSFDDIKQYADAVPRPYETRRHLVEDVAPNIVNLGLNEFDRRKYYEIAMSDKKPVNARAARFLGWLVGQPPMNEFKYAVEQANLEREVTLRGLAALATHEVIMRQKQHQLREHKSYSTHIPIERQAFEDKRDILDAYRALCESFLLGRPSQN
ncbi:hypothetical protein H0X09_01200 [Candidatus Saccharibacteria bacterium]|nr:hypothetical protein [Candidatus Saccharibacteria bacterium]